MDLSTLITQEGMDRLQRRIQELLRERPAVIKAVATAREYGDLSENAEYKSARERQRQIDTELDYLRRRAAHLKVIDINSIPKDRVRFGAICRIRDTANGDEIIYQIIGAEEINFFEKEGIQPVSVLSPIGNSLLGKQVGDKVVVDAPMGERILEILEIS